MKRCALIFGTRPEAIKLAPVYHELQQRSSQVQPLLWLTGQHAEMLQQVLDIFKMKADRDLALMQPNQTLAYLTSHALSKLSSVLDEERPDIILVQGDTTTAFVAALAAFYHKIPVGHIEAGLRTGEKYSPFPEEINRSLISKIAEYHFAHTPNAKQNLLKEGIPAHKVWVTGNTVIDALDYTKGHIAETSASLPESFPKEKVLNGRKMVLITGHRRENFGDGIKGLCFGIKELARKHPDVLFVYPVHPNPNIKEVVYSLLSAADNIYLTEPLDYPSFVWAMDHCHFIISDSGGVQEEAPHLGKPVLVTRQNTERPESIAAGTAILVGTDGSAIFEMGSKLLEDEAFYSKMRMTANPYGDGRAAKRIVDVICSI